MRYFGGGIGHLKNAPQLQVPGFNPIDPTSESEEMPVAVEEGKDLGTVVQQPSSDVVNSRELVQLEVNEDDEDEDDDNDDDDSDSDEGGDQTDEDEDSDGEGEDDYGYASA